MFYEKLKYKIVFDILKELKHFCQIHNLKNVILSRIEFIQIKMANNFQYNKLLLFMTLKLT